jgi:predicted GTPase
LIVDPRGGAVGEIADIFSHYPDLGPVLPAIGYDDSQLSALEETINSVKADVVVAATPCDLGNLIDINKPLVRARYELAEVGAAELTGLIEDFLKRLDLVPPGST